MNCTLFRKGMLCFSGKECSEFPKKVLVLIGILNLSVEEMDAYSDALSELGFKYNVQHDIWMMPVVKNQQHFYHWAASYPFYSNVQKEGVVLYEAA